MPRKKFCTKQVFEYVLLFLLLTTAFFVSFHYPPSRLAAAILLLFIAIALNRSLLNAIAKSPERAWIVLYVIFVGIAISWSSDTNIGWWKLRYALALLLIPVVGYWLQTANNGKQYALFAQWAFLIGLKVAVVYGVLIVFNFVKPYGAGNSLFHNSSYLYVGHTAGLFSLISIYLMTEMTKQKKFLQATYWILWVTTSLILLFSLYSRGAQLSFFIALLFLLMWSLRDLRKWIATLLGIFVTVVLAVGAISFSSTLKMRINDSAIDLRQIKSGDLRGSWGQRVAFWKLGIEAWKEHPVLGHGTGAEASVKPILYEKMPHLVQFIPNGHIHHLHNQYIETLKQHGVVGLILLLGIFISLWRLALPHNRFFAFVMLLYLAIANLSNAMLLRFDVVIQLAVVFIILQLKAFYELSPIRFNHHSNIQS